jgi:hypothetical protein
VTNTFSLDIQNRDGDTALHLALHYGDTKDNIACKLIYEGANYRLKNIKGATAYDIGKELDTTGGCLYGAEKGLSYAIKTPKTRSRRTTFRRATTRRRR